MQKLYGHSFAQVFTVMVLLTAFASVFAGMLGYSRIPYAAARDGYFFKVFARLHPKGQFPYISLLVMGGISIACGFLDLGQVIDALLATRILIQFMGQIVAVVLLRKYRPDMVRPYRMWLYPVFCFVAFVGWAFLFSTTKWPIMRLGFYTLAAGIAAYFVWSKFAKLPPEAPLDRV
jgi:amino acid transporter